MVAPILWLSTTNTTHSNTSTKASSRPLKAFCKISMKPLMASAL